jgi:hypothetical protein
VDLGLDGVAVEEHEVLAPLGRLVDPRLELVDLKGLVCDGQAAGLLEVAVDGVVAGKRDQRPKVDDAFALENLELVGEVPDPVGETVGERCLAEATVPTRCAKAHRLLLEDGDPDRRIGVGQLDRRPETREPGTDDHHVRGRGALERPPDRPRRRRCEPVADGRRRIVVLGHDPILR